MPHGIFIQLMMIYHFLIIIGFVETIFEGPIRKLTKLFNVNIFEYLIFILDLGYWTRWKHFPNTVKCKKKVNESSLSASESFLIGSLKFNPLYSRNEFDTAYNPIEKCEMDFNWCQFIRCCDSFILFMNHECYVFNKRKCCLIHILILIKSFFIRIYLQLWCVALIKSTFIYIKLRTYSSTLESHLIQMHL